MRTGPRGPATPLNDARPCAFVDDDVVEGMRAVLAADGVAVRVFDGTDWHDLPLVTIRLAEDEEAFMDEQKEDVVLLKERWPTAFVRLHGEWLAGVPLFRERRTAGGVEEVRVTVEALREHRAAAEEAPSTEGPGFVKRLFK